jgi:hypothetical protein
MLGRVKAQERRIISVSRYVCIVTKRFQPKRREEKTIAQIHSTDDGGSGDKGDIAHCPASSGNKKGGKR